MRARLQVDHPRQMIRLLLVMVAMTLPVLAACAPDQQSGSGNSEAPPVTALPAAGESGAFATSLAPEGWTIDQTTASSDPQVSPVQAYPREQKRLPAPYWGEEDAPATFETRTLGWRPPGEDHLGLVIGSSFTRMEDGSISTFPQPAIGDFQAMLQTGSTYVEIHGVQGFLTPGDQGGSGLLMWEERPGIMVQMRWIAGSIDPLAVADGIYEISEDAYTALLAVSQPGATIGTITGEIGGEPWVFDAFVPFGDPWGRDGLLGRGDPPTGCGTLEYAGESQSICADRFRTDQYSLQVILGTRRFVIGVLIETSETFVVRDTYRPGLSRPGLSVEAQVIASADHPDLRWVVAPIDDPMGVCLVIDAGVGTDSPPPTGDSVPPIPVVPGFSTLTAVPAGFSTPAGACLEIPREGPS